MSVEYCVVRVTPGVFRPIHQQPRLMQELMEELYKAPSDRAEENVCIDSRNVFRGSSVGSPSIIRMLYLDEFTTSLLVDFMNEASPFFVAIAGWGQAQLLDGVQYGYGDILYYHPDEAKVIASSPYAYPDTSLESRFREHANDFRISSAG